MGLSRLWRCGTSSSIGLETFSALKIGHGMAHAKKSPFLGLPASRNFCCKILGINKFWCFSVMLRDRCARCLPVMRVVAMSFACVLHLAMSSCALHHHVFKTFNRPGLQVLSVVCSESKHTCTRPRTSEIVFYKWVENVLGMG